MKIRGHSVQWELSLLRLGCLLKDHMVLIFCICKNTMPKKERKGMRSLGSGVKNCQALQMSAKNRVLWIVLNPWRSLLFKLPTVFCFQIKPIQSLNNFWLMVKQCVKQLKWTDFFHVCTQNVTSITLCVNNRRVWQMESWICLICHQKLMNCPQGLASVTGINTKLKTTAVETK